MSGESVSLNRRRLLHAIAAGALVSTECVPVSVCAAEGKMDGGDLHRRLRFTLTFRNPTDQILTSQLFWCYLPAYRPPYQVLHSVQVSQQPYEILHDVLGHRILALSFERLVGQAHKVVSLTAEVLLQPLKPDTDRVRGGEAVWLHPQNKIESDNLRIMAQAGLLRRETPLATARAIYEWVIQHINYSGYLAEEMGAVYALTKQEGDCSEYADLVAALARAAQIPARVVGGYVVDRDTTPRPQDYHNWAELYLDGAWRLVDAQKQYWFDSPYQYIVYRIHHDDPMNPVGLAHRYRTQGELIVSF